MRVLESGSLEILIGSGPGARYYSIPLPTFTWIATTRSIGGLPSQIASIGTIEELSPYSKQELALIVTEQSRSLDVRLTPGAAVLAALSSGPTPGGTSALLKRIQRLSGGGIIDEHALATMLRVLGVSPNSSQTFPGLIAELKQMSGIEFENWTAALFLKHGYRVNTTRVVGDHGIDLEIFRGGRKVVVQCKRWNDTIGEPLIREFYGSMLNTGADAGVFVTSSSFSNQARDFAINKSITLLDIDTLINLFLYGGAVED